MLFHSSLVNAIRLSFVGKGRTKALPCRQRLGNTALLKCRNAARA